MDIVPLCKCPDPKFGARWQIFFHDYQNQWMCTHDFLHPSYVTYMTKGVSLHKNTNYKVFIVYFLWWKLHWKIRFLNFSCSICFASMKLQFKIFRFIFRVCFWLTLFNNSWVKRIVYIYLLYDCVMFYHVNTKSFLKAAVRSHTSHCTTFSTTESLHPCSPENLTG